MPRGKARYRRATVKLGRCLQCGSKSAFIYRCEDGKDRCIVCVIKETRRWVEEREARKQ